MKKFATIVACVGGIALSGCQYYRVTEPVSRKAYITDNWHMSQHGLVFTDLATGDSVRLMSAEYRKISKAQAKAAIASGCPECPTTAATFK